MRGGSEKVRSTPVVKGDMVTVIAGKERGKSGKVIEVLAKKKRVLVEKLNFVKRHSKPTQQHKQGGIVEKESSIHWSNVLLLCSKCNKPSRNKYKTVSGGKKVRICGKCGEQIDIST